MSITLFCPAQIGLKYLKKKWTIELLFAMHKRQHTYKELKDEILGISDKILSERLRELNKLDLIENVKYSDYNRKYSLTEKGVLIN